MVHTAGACSQSTGQGHARHRRSSRTCGQARPPNRGSTQSRRRCCIPPPQLCVQVVHGCHSPSLPSSTHECTLHMRFSVRNGHVCPSCRLTCTTLRDRLRKPTPHERLHGVHAPYVLTMQSTGQGPGLHVLTSLSCRHAAPPKCGSVMTRVRQCVPLLVGQEQPAADEVA